MIRLSNPRGPILDGAGKQGIVPMKQVQRWVPVVAAAGILVGAGIAGAWRSAPVVPMAAPTTIGVVRLGSLMDGLQEAKDKSASLEARRADWAAQIKLLETEIQTLQAQLEANTLQGSARFEALQDIGEKQVLAEARTRGYEARLDIARGDMMREIYEKVVAASEQFARTGGYDMIVVDDRSFGLAALGRSTTQQHLESIQRRRVLFAGESLDVTDQLLTQMNNSYRASGAGGAARP